MPVSSNEIKKVLVLYTGGTIGMKKNKQGAFAPQPNIFLRKIRCDPELNISKEKDELELPMYGHDKHPRVMYQIREYNPLLDSSNMSPDNWALIAKNIGDEYENWDGFVVLHGTDTLAYTASALSFMLRGTQKPIIVTGSQIPIFVTGSDAKNNFLTSVKLAASDEIKEVCVCFANQLMRGNRTVKLSSESIRAFSTPNYHRLADMGVECEVDPRFALNNSIGPTFSYDLNENVVILRIFPTMSERMLRYVLDEPTEGVVLLSYGAGNIPNKDYVKNAIREAVNRDVVIVNLTQCVRGTVRSLYETGEILEELGVLPGYDMTVEAAFTKLIFVLGQSQLSLEQKKSMMTTDLCGELTRSD